MGWRWFWDAGSESEEDYLESISCQSNCSDVTDTTDSDGAMSRDTPTLISHTVPFKCIGTTKEHSYQDILAEANRLIRTCETVPVRLTPDPSNPINAKAIPFECQINGHWQRIGYAVNEVLDELHRDMRNNVIIGVNFKNGSNSLLTGTEVDRVGLQPSI